MTLTRLRSLREDSDYKQTYIAHMLNVSQRTYSRYENGERAIPLSSLCILADFYQTSVDYLIGRTDTKTPYPSAGQSPRGF
ncbi:helix-turn-helix transcriptional regulator [Lachnospiraceae bacterium 29-84]